LHPAHDPAMLGLGQQEIGDLACGSPVQIG
jgi:hypothetical protein